MLLASPVIPFNKPVHLGTELAAMATAIEDNGHVAGGGPFGRLCEERLESLLGSRTLLVTSATHALEMAALLLDLKPGDEVIVPSFTFVSTANAFALHGAKVVFGDVDAQGNLRLDEVERLVGPRTRAVVPVHYGGSCCDLDALAKVANNVPLVEDAAQALSARFREKPLGTFGALAAISFHETKNVGCGEGGALVINDPSLIDRAEYLREKGTNRRKFQEGLVDKYTWVDVGSSYVLSDLNAAYLSTQLAQLERIQRRREEIHRRYENELGPSLSRAGADWVRPGPEVSPNHHLFGVVFKEADQRKRFIAFMRERQIIAPFHYVALHLSPMGKRFHDGRPLPGSERLSSCLVRLPLYFNMTPAEQDRVISCTEEFLRAL